jgi:hypothetical protein
MKHEENTTKQVWRLAEYWNQEKKCWQKAKDADYLKNI